MSPFSKDEEIYPARASQCESCTYPSKARLFRIRIHILDPKVLTLTAENTFLYRA